MGRFINSENGVVVSVADDKDDRFASPLWEPQGEEKPAKRSASRKSTDSE